MRGRYLSIVWLIWPLCIARKMLKDRGRRSAVAPISGAIPLAPCPASTMPWHPPGAASRTSLQRRRRPHGAWRRCCQRCSVPFELRRLVMSRPLALQALPAGRRLRRIDGPPSRRRMDRSPAERAQLGRARSRASNSVHLPAVAMRCRLRGAGATRTKVSEVRPHRRSAPSLLFSSRVRLMRRVGTPTRRQASRGVRLLARARGGWERRRPRTALGDRAARTPALPCAALLGGRLALSCCRLPVGLATGWWAGLPPEACGARLGLGLRAWWEHQVLRPGGPGEACCGRGSCLGWVEASALRMKSRTLLEACGCEQREKRLLAKAPAPERHDSLR